MRSSTSLLARQFRRIQVARVMESATKQDQRLFIGVLALGATVGAIDGLDQSEDDLRREYAFGQRTLLEPIGLTSHFSSLRRHQTLKKLESSKTKDTLHSKYKVQWSKPLGEGTFGSVYLAKNRLTGEEVAIKKIPKRYTGGFLDSTSTGVVNSLLNLDVR